MNIFKMDQNVDHELTHISIQSHIPFKIQLYIANKGQGTLNPTKKIIPTESPVQMHRND